MGRKADVDASPVEGRLWAELASDTYAPGNPAPRAAAGPFRALACPSLAPHLLQVRPAGVNPKLSDVPVAVSIKGNQKLTLATSCMHQSLPHDYRIAMPD